MEPTSESVYVDADGQVWPDYVQVECACGYAMVAPESMRDAAHKRVLDHQADTHVQVVRDPRLVTQLVRRMQPPPSTAGWSAAAQFAHGGG